MLRSSSVLTAPTLRSAGKTRRNCYPCLQHHLSSNSSSSSSRIYCGGGMAGITGTSSKPLARSTKIELHSAAMRWPQLQRSREDQAGHAVHSGGSIIYTSRSSAAGGSSSSSSIAETSGYLHAWRGNNQHLHQGKGGSYSPRRHRQLSSTSWWTGGSTSPSSSPSGGAVKEGRPDGSSPDKHRQQQHQQQEQDRWRGGYQQQNERALDQRAGGALFSCNA